MCCALSGYLFDFEIFTGKRAKTDGSPESIIVRLLHGKGFESNPGRILYCDNWYTRLPLLTRLASLCKMAMVGTINLTKKEV